MILDFLGDIGGFKEAILLMMVTTGEYFSAKFFISKVAGDMYIRKKRDKADDAKKPGARDFGTKPNLGSRFD